MLLQSMLQRLIKCYILFLTHDHFKANAFSCLFKKAAYGNSLEAHWLGLSTFTARAWVQSLVRELRSHKLCGMAKNKCVCHKLVVVRGRPRTRRPPKLSSWISEVQDSVRMLTGLLQSHRKVPWVERILPDLNTRKPESTASFGGGLN